MLLSPADSDLFFKLHRALMHFANQQLNIVPDIASPDQFSSLPHETRQEVCTALLDRMDMIELFVEQNRAKLTADEIDIVLSWRHLVAGRFYVFRQLKKYMVFLAADDPPVAYGVVALTEPFEDLIGTYLPVMVDAVLLPFKGMVIYDGLLNGYNITFGGGIKRSMNNSYREAKQRLDIVTCLPITSIPILAKQKKPSKHGQRAPRTRVESTSCGCSLPERVSSREATVRT